MPVLTRSSLEASPLADLHELASELELDGFRRLRKADLVDRLLDVPGAGEEGAGSRRLRKADLVDRILDVHGAGEEVAEDPAEEPAPAAEEKPKRARSRS